MGTVVFFEVGHASFRSLVPTLAEMGQQCPCNLRGEKKRLMKQTEWEISCWLSHLQRLALPGKNIVQRMQIDQVTAWIAFPVVSFWLFA